MIGDVSGVESRGCMPLPIALGREPLARVPRRVGVTVEVDDYVLWISHPDRRHRTWNDGTGAVHDDDAGQRRQHSERFTRYRSASRRCTSNPPEDDAQHDRREDRGVLSEREQRERVEHVADGREHRIRRRVDEPRIGHRQARFGVPDGGRAGQGGRQNDRRGGQHRS